LADFYGHTVHHKFDLSPNSHDQYLTQSTKVITQSP